MGRRKGDGNHSLSKNNLIQDSEGNESRLQQNKDK
jgi:hypothetical protein